MVLAGKLILDTVEPDEAFNSQSLGWLAERTEFRHRELGATRSIVGK